jgi:lysozyme
MLSMNAQVECEDTCSHIHGIDLSHYQGNVFWEAIGDNSKMAYVYLKATEGGDRVDDKYKENIEIAHRYGLKVGSYHFYRPRIAQETQLANFMAQCRPGDQDLIPMIDIETRSGLSQEAFTDSLFKFLDLIEEAYKQKPLIYVGTNFYNNNLQNKLNDYKIMVAQYTQREPVLSDNRDITIWQYTGKGHINGITGYVDKSRFLGKHRLREIRFRHR